MKAIIVSVDYSDILAITLPYNRHHFDEVLVVTSPKDVDTAKVAGANGAEVFVTDSFYDDGASFNKWKALEEGFNVLGRYGWICNMDADVLWPRSIRVQEGLVNLGIGRAGVDLGWCDLSVKPGTLCSPLRRMWNDWPQTPFVGHIVCGSVPDERDWSGFPIHRNVNEWAGYSQIFHADDPHLGPAPWHEIDWVHAGGADSFFQRKWPAECKVRPPFEVLHLGPAGKNWFGRATPLADGTVPDEAPNRLRACEEIWRQRRARERAGLPRFAREKIAPKNPQEPPLESP